MRDDIDAPFILGAATMTQGSYVVGFTLLLISLVCLGSWPAFLRLSSFPSLPATTSKLPSCFHWLLGCKINRDTRFSYLDYALSYAISSCLPLLLALASSGSGGSDSNEQSTSSSYTTSLPHILFAIFGGSMLCIGNLSMAWATTVFGAPLTTVVAIQASLTVLLGTSINYFLEPQKTPHPGWLIAGVVAFWTAIALATKAHLVYGETVERNRDRVCIELANEGQNVTSSPQQSYGSLDSSESLESTTSSLEGGNGGGDVLMMDPSSSQTTHSPKIALLIAALGGCCFGFFSPCFNIAVNNPFHWIHTQSLSVPVANLWFSLAFTGASFVGNMHLLYKPPMGMNMPSTTLSEYFTVESLSDRKLSILAGFLCGMANLLQFQGGRLVGFATADLVQAFPLVSTMWDVFLFGEFKGATSRSGGGVVLGYIGTMYLMYTCGIGFLIASAMGGVE